MMVRLGYSSLSLLGWGQLIPNPVARRCCSGCQAGQAEPGFWLPPGGGVYQVSLPRKDRETDLKSNLLADSVTENIVHLKEAQIMAGWPSTDL